MAAAAEGASANPMAFQGDGARPTVLRPGVVLGLLVLIVGIAAIARFWGIWFGLPHGQTRPDETYIMDVALAILRGQRPPPHYDYPWLYVWITSGAYLVYYVWGYVTGGFSQFADLAQSWYTHWEPFFLINRSISAAFGTLTALLLFRFGRRLWDDATGLVAALFIAVAYLHARDSHYGTTDVTMTFFITAAVMLLMHAHATGRQSLFALAGLTAGLASATKYNAVVLVVPAFVSWLLNVMDSPGQRWRAAWDPRLLAFGVPFACVFAIGVPFVVADYPAFRHAMSELLGSMESGSPHLELEPGWVHHFRFSLRYGLGEPLMAAGLGGAMLMLVKDWRRAALLLSFPVAYYIVAGASRNQFYRYVIATLPFLCLTGAFAVREVTRWLMQQSPRVSAGPAMALLAVAIALIPAGRIFQFDRIIAQTDNRVVVSNWFSENVPAGSSILQTGSHYGHAWFDANLQYRLWTWDRGHAAFVVDKQPSEELPDWILVQDHPLSSNREIIAEYLRRGYALAWTFPALTHRTDRIFDLEDAFYMPFAGFAGVTRPGPNFTLYRRINALGPHEPGK